MTDKEEVSEKYDVSLDTYALITVIKAIQAATKWLVEDSADAALQELNLAWTLLPNSVRTKFPLRPDRLIAKAFNDTVPSEAELMKKDPEHPYPFESIQDEAWARSRARSIRDQAYTDIAVEKVQSLSAEFIEALDNAGLYVRAGRGAIIETSRRVPKEQPPTGKLPPTLPRETK